MRATTRRGARDGHGGAGTNGKGATVLAFDVRASIPRCGLRVGAYLPPQPERARIPVMALGGRPTRWSKKAEGGGGRAMTRLTYFETHGTLCALWLI